MNQSHRFDVSLRIIYIKYIYITYKNNNDNIETHMILDDYL